MVVTLSFPFARSRLNSNSVRLSVANPIRPSNQIFISILSSLNCKRRQQHTYTQEPNYRDDQGRLLSRVSGPSNEPLLEITLGQFWRERVNKFGDRPALIVRHEPFNHHDLITEETSQKRIANDDNCIRWTFSQMDEHIQKLIRGMRSYGVGKGDRIAVLMMNSSNMASLQIATSFLGAILVTLNPSYTSKELLRALNHIQAKFLFIVPSLRSSNYLENLLKILPSLQSSTSAEGEDRTLINDDQCPSLKRIVLVDNLTQRPKRWGSESILGKLTDFTFMNAMEKLNGYGIDYRSLLISKDDDGNKIHSREEEGLSCKDIINLQFTSGTTGNPKAVALSSRNLINNGMMLGKLMNLKETDILTNVPPLFHCFGLTLGNLAAWSKGSCILYPSEGFNPVRTLRAASEENATAIHGVPAHFIAELDILRKVRKAQESEENWDPELTEKYGIQQDERWNFKLRTGFASGSTVPIELMHSIMDDNLLGAKEQTVVYGMTETSPVSFGCEVNAPVRNRCETVGKVVEHCHAKIVNPEDIEGKPLPVGEIGELCTGGYLIMEGGYWNDSKKTQEVLEIHKDEPEITWMRTGDLALINEDGYTEIKGRVKDLIIRGGENIAPIDIENCIDTLPGIISSAAIAVPDEKMGETVGVFISLSNYISNEQKQSSLQPSQIRHHVKQHLSGQCAPDWIWFIGKDGIESEMPATASGKVQKVILRKWAIDLVEKGIGKVTKEIK